MTPKIGQNLSIETEKNIQVLDVLSDETRLFYSSTEHPFYLIQTTGTVNTHPLRSVSVFQFFSYIPSGIGMSSEDVAVKPVPTEEQFNDAIARAKEVSFFESVLWPRARPVELIPIAPPRDAPSCTSKANSISSCSSRLGRAKGRAFRGPS